MTPSPSTSSEASPHSQSSASEPSHVHAEEDARTRFIATSPVPSSEFLTAPSRPRLPRDPKSISPKPFTNLVRLRIPERVVREIREALMVSSNSGKPDYAAVRRLVAKSAAQQASELVTALKKVHPVETIHVLPRLHEVIVRMPRRVFEPWMHSADGLRLVFRTASIRDQRIYGPSSGKRSNEAATAASSGKVSHPPIDLLRLANITPLHALGYRGQNQVIGLLDSGVTGQPAASVVDFADFSAQGKLNPATNAVSFDNGRHGTQMTSILLKICPDAKLAVGAVLDGPPGDEGGKIPPITAGLEWLIDKLDAGRNISVVNISIDIQDPSSEGFEALVDNLQLASIQGIQPVVAIGNTRKSRSLIADMALSVGSLNHRGSSIADFSGRLPHVVAPGDRIGCLLPSGLPMVCSGTSKSAAVVAASLALLVQASNQDVLKCVEAVRRAASQANRGYWFRSKKRWGDGPLDVHAAFQLL